VCDRLALLPKLFADWFTLWLKGTIDAAGALVEEHAMTVKEAILKAVEDLPEECLDDLASYADLLRHKAAVRSSPTAMASERVLAADWLRPEEDETWRNL
jgi:hypothetical protein